MTSVKSFLSLAVLSVAYASPVAVPPEARAQDISSHPTSHQSFSSSFAEAKSARQAPAQIPTSDDRIADASARATSSAQRMSRRRNRKAQPPGSLNGLQETAQEDWVKSEVEDAKHKAYIWSQQHRRNETAQQQSTAAKFTVQQVRNENFEARTGLEEMVRTYQKYKAPLTPQLQRALEKNTELQNKMKRYNYGLGATQAKSVGGDSEYVAKVEIGTPPQQLYLDFDTGSADLWVFSTDTAKNEVDGQTLYQPADSTTAKELDGYTWSIGYGDGSNASGIVYTDRVAVGTVSFPTQAVESAQNVSDGFSSDNSSSGLMGLGMSSGNTVQPQQQKTFIDNIAPTLAEPLFTADLRHLTPGAYDFGFISNWVFKGGLAYTPIDPESIYWAFNASGYQIGSSSILGLGAGGIFGGVAADADTTGTDAINGWEEQNDPEAGSGTTGDDETFVASPWQTIADTGTTLLLVPDDVAAAYYAAVPGSDSDDDSGGYVFPCDATLPDFIFGVAGAALYRGVVPGRYINFGQVNSTTCFGGIQTSDGIGFSIMGDIALKAQFVVFDLGQKRLGFANKFLWT